MYEAHFGFAELPFPTAQDPRHYVDTAPHRAAVLALLAGFECGDEFILVSGEFGVGKTTVARRMLAQVDRERHRVVELASLCIEGGELFDRIAEALGAQDVDTGHGLRELPHLLADLAADGQDALVVVDEAQRLDIASLDSLRELTAVRVRGRGVLHLCLIGRAAPPGIEALQRMGRPLNVGATVTVGPLDAAGTRDYVVTRLKQVGWRGRPSFDEGAFAEIHARCGGVPAYINRLCGHLLLQLYMLRRDEVTAAVVCAVDDLLQSELDGVPSTLELPPGPEPTPAPETRALLAVPDLPEWRRAGAALVVPTARSAPAGDRWRRHAGLGAASAAVLLTGGVAWYAMSSQGTQRVDEPRLAAIRPAAASAVAPIALEATAQQVLARSPPGAGTRPAARAPAAPGGERQALAFDATPMTVIARVPQAPRAGAIEDSRHLRRVRTPEPRPPGSPPTAAACSLEAETLGLCRMSRAARPAHDAARESAGEPSPAAVATTPARPPCEPTRAALGLCP